MVKRIDHISRLTATEGSTQEEPDKEAPHVASDLADYLAARGFGVFNLIQADNSDSSEAIARDVSRASGELRVLQFLRRMVNNQVSR